jgi:hypothetical protein
MHPHQFMERSVSGVLYNLNKMRLYKLKFSYGIGSAPEGLRKGESESDVSRNVPAALWQLQLDTADILEESVNLFNKAPSHISLKCA